MTTVYPASLDALPRPTAITARNASGFELHSVIDNLSDAIEAIEAKLGIGVSTAAGNQVLRGTGAGASAFGAIATADLAANAITQLATAVGSTSAPTTTAASYTDLAQMSVTMTTTGGPVLVFFSGSFFHSAAHVLTITALNRDSAGQEFATAMSSPGTAGDLYQMVIIGFFTPTAASHTWKVQWYNGSGTLTANGVDRRMFAVELKR